MIIIGNDHGGYELAIKLYSQMLEKQWHVHHIGCCSTTPTHYPLFAQRLVKNLEKVIISGYSDLWNWNRHVYGSK